MSDTFLGAILAIGASVFNSYGYLLQKKVVNAVSPESKNKRFFKILSKHPLWLLGAFMQLVISTAFLLSAQYLIGPTLISGLQGIGLIFLVIGSIRVNDEKVANSAKLGIFFLIVSTILAGYSELYIRMAEFDFQQAWFLQNSIVFSVVSIIIILLLEFCQGRASIKNKAVLLSVISGFMLSLSNFWISPLVGTIGQIFMLQANAIQWMLFLTACILLVSVNILAISKIQVAFRYGPASSLIPIRLIPSLISPFFIYYFVYDLTSPKAYSLWFYMISIVLIISSTSLFSTWELEIDASKNAI